MRIRTKHLNPPVLALCVLAGASLGATAGAATTQNASIPFAAIGGIHDWKADGDKGLYVESLQHKWFYAKLMGPCTGLQFKDRVAFMTEPGGDLDKFSAIIVEGHVCHFVDFTPTANPSLKPRK